MANMSYCRFENTNRDLEDCKEALENLTDGTAGPLSEFELPAAKNLIRNCMEIINHVAGLENIALSLNGGWERMEERRDSILEEWNERWG